MIHEKTGLEPVLSFCKINKRVVRTSSDDKFSEVLVTTEPSIGTDNEHSQH